DWWRSASLSPRPARTWQRGELLVTSRTEDPHRPGRVLVRCEHRGDEFELSPTDAACAGLVSCPEAAHAARPRVGGQAPRRRVVRRALLGTARRERPASGASPARQGGRVRAAALRRRLLQAAELDEPAVLPRGARARRGGRRARGHL